jgi:PAS domain S-box-containing protein
MRGFSRFVEDETGPAVGRTVELTAVRKDGKDIPIELCLSSIQIKGRWHSVGIIRDITERKEVEEQLRVHREELADLVEERTTELKREIAERDRARAEARERETMLRTLFEEALNPVMITDEAGLFIDANRAAVEFLECDLEQLLKNDVWSFLPAENMDYIDSEAMPFFDSKTLETEYPVGTRKKTLLLNIVPVTVSGKKLLFFIGQEITERKKLHEELMKAQKLESVGVLAGGIAHDFNNILTSILSNISLAKLSLDRDGRTYRLLYEAEKASLRARDLTQQLLTFSKGGAPVKKTASIERTLRDSADFALRGSNVRCEYHIQDGLWPVDIDEGQISQAVSNLIINADHSMPEGGIISVTAENIMLGPNDLPHLESGRYVWVSIQDNGTGIPPRHIDRIFDPYFTTKHEGSGLGLTTTYSIIKNHGGYITVESDLGAGTNFRLYLPASEREFEAPPEVEEKIFAGRGRILVMDDDEDIRHSVAEALRLFGYEVCFACDGTETIDLYKKEMDSGRCFDAIIMDLTVPGGMGGVEAIARLRQIDPGLKALASSGYSNSPVMSDYKKYGFAGVITKPYKIEELSKALHDVVSG